MSRLRGYDRSIDDDVPFGAYWWAYDPEVED